VTSTTVAVCAGRGRSMGPPTRGPASRRDHAPRTAGRILVAAGFYQAADRPGDLGQRWFELGQGACGHQLTTFPMQTGLC